MPENTAPGTGADALDILALSTTLEEDFISPVTAMRGALELLDDNPGMETADRQRFVARALAECKRLQESVQRLSKSVYEAGQRATGDDAGPEAVPDADPRISTDAATGVLELDLSDIVFDSAATVNTLFDRVDQTVIASNRQWYFLVNVRNCSVWPEAWVSYAYRTKKVKVNYVLGMVRYAEPGEGEAPGDDPAILPSRAAALEKVDEMRNTNA